LLVQTFFLCIGITYLSLFLLDLLISNLLFSSYALVFKLGQNLSNIPRSIFLKQKFPLILLSVENKASRYKTFHYSYLFQRKKHSDLTSFLQIRLLFLAQSFTIQVDYYALGKKIYAQSFHSFRSYIQT
jgi:hypothetical protein